MDNICCLSNILLGCQWASGLLFHDATPSTSNTCWWIFTCRHIPFATALRTNMFTLYFVWKWAKVRAKRAKRGRPRLVLSEKMKPWESPFLLYHISSLFVWANPRLTYWRMSQSCLWPQSWLSSTIEEKNLLIKERICYKAPTYCCVSQQDLESLRFTTH